MPHIEEGYIRASRGWRNHRYAYSNAEEDSVAEFVPFHGVPLGRTPPDGLLQVTQIDMLSAKNTKEHHTNRYYNPLLIVRRGQEFQVEVTFNRSYDPSRDKFQLEFRIGSDPQVNDKSFIIVSPIPGQKSSWHSRLLKNTDNSLLMGITPSASCIVGKFRMYVTIITPVGLIRDKNKVKEIFILFNPWAPADAVFMPSNQEREEYVLNQVGMIYTGDYKTVLNKPWNYGQFESGILDACLFLMDNATIPLINRGDPIKVARQASAKMNSPDDNGVLVGNWSGDYSFGRAPTSWIGSVEILRSYASNGVPLCYAQCWVYAGVLNTFLRSLGIPSRVVTNFRSAHDNDGNLMMDIILDDKGNIDKKDTKDSIWNFHCWNECYMTRPDLPVGFGGWQVVDSTTQENSDGMYRCGPTSVFAIKQGMICFPYDAAFVFSEVNSNAIYYRKEKNRTLTKLYVDKTDVGKLIVTKQIGQNSWTDITNQYKYPEGTTEERLALKIAEDYGCAHDQTALPKADVEIKALVQDVMINKDFQLTLQLKNLGRTQYNVEVFVNGNVLYYTGVLASQFMSTTLNVQLDPSKTVTKLLDVKADDYMKKLVEQSNLNFIIMGKVKETGQVVSLVQPITLQAPKLTLKVSDSQKMNEIMTVTVEFTNTLGFDLENVTVNMEGPGVFSTRTRKYSLIGSDSTITWSESFTPETEGQKTLMACLDSALLRHVCGHVDFTVRS